MAAYRKTQDGSESSCGESEDRNYSIDISSYYDDSDEFIDGENEYWDFRNKWPFGVKGGAKDVPLPSGAACLQINKVLGHTEKNAGEFTFQGRADSLPVAPGLMVEGDGCIPLPLCEEVAAKVIALSEKSPYGRNHETLVDENVRKSWQLEASQVKVTNPQWQQGIDELTTKVAQRLGLEGVPLECKLYKLLVYAEGGHFAKHKDTEKEDGMIATLVVQPPSLHEGGDLAVYRDTETEFRHDFGKKDGTAAFAPHYAVHYADAEHALETVTKGFRLVLVYSICMPPTIHVPRVNDKQVSDELASAISAMKDGDDSFALLLAHQYTEKSVGGLGYGALKGIDRARFNALEEANAAVPVEKKLLLFVAQLAHTRKFYDDSRDEGCWRLNFLNPGFETLSFLWRPYGSSTYEGSLGNESATRDTTYSRYAIVAIPASDAEERVLTLINEDAAAWLIKCQKPGDSVVLTKLLDAVNAKLTKPNKNRYGDEETVSIAFCTEICELLVAASDPKLVNRFFNECWTRLGNWDSDATKRGLVSPLISIASAFEWSAIKDAFLKALIRSREFKMLTAMKVIDGLDHGLAQRELLQVVVDKAVALGDDKLCCAEWLEPLCKHVLHCEDSDMFRAVAGKFLQMEASLLRPGIEAFTKHLDAFDEDDEKFTALGEIAGRRLKWLNHQIRSLDKPFSWKMPYAEFPDEAQIQTFLQGPDATMSTQGVKTFENAQDAQNYAAWIMRREHQDASFEVEIARAGSDFFTTISKTRDWFSRRQELLLQRQTELKFLMEHYRQGACK